MIKRVSNRNALAIIALGAFIFSFPSLSICRSQETADARADFATTREDILKFEDVLNEAIASNFSSSAFAVVQKAKGAYVPGFGISYSFLINIHRAVIKTPFGQVRPRNTVSLEEKIRRIEQLKEKLIQVLQNGGNYFPQLRKDERVAVIAFVEDRNFPGEPNANKTIVMSALKKDLDELGQRTDRAKEFKQRMKIVEY